MDKEQANINAAIGLAGDHATNNPDEFLACLDPSDVVHYLIHQFGAGEVSPQRGEAAKGFLARAVPDVLWMLVEKELDDLKDEGLQRLSHAERMGEV